MFSKTSVQSLHVTWPLVELKERTELKIEANAYIVQHGDVIKWKHFPRYWPFLRGIQRSPVNFPRETWHDPSRQNWAALPLRYTLNKSVYKFPSQSIKYIRSNVTTMMADKSTTLQYAITQFSRVLIGLTHLPLMPHVCVTALGRYWFGLWLVVFSVPSHYLNQ